MDGPTDRLTDWKDRWRTGWTDRQIYQLADGWTDRWMHGMERHGRDKRADDGLIDKRLDIACVASVSSRVIARTQLSRRTRAETLATQARLDRVTE